MSAQIVDLAAPGRPAPAVAALLDRLNAFTAPRALRAWQAEVLATGALAIASPLDGTRLVADATLWLDPGGFAYRFRHGPATLWLLTGGCMTGWHMAGLAMAPLGLAFARTPADLPLLRHQLPQIVAVGEPEAPSRVCVVVGHPNFAHHLWNELPALVAARPEAIDATLVLWEPILPFDRLVDWQLPLTRTSEAAIRPPPGRLDAGLRLQLGSTRIPAALAARLCGACAGHDALLPGGSAAPAIALGLRTMYRKPANQLAFARDLLARLPPGLDVYLDGFALPDDIDVPGRHDAGQFRAWQDGAHALAAELLRAAPAVGPRLIDATRLSVPQAIALGGRLRAYVAPHGTQQHKFGWLRPLPGVVHSSPEVVRDDQAAWLADQCEHHGPTAYLPGGMVATAPGDGLRQDDPWYQDYRFVDTAAAAAYAAASLAPYLTA